MKIAIIVLVIIVQAICGFSQPLLKADPCEDGIEKFILVVNDVEVGEITAFERYNWLFVQDLNELELVDGFHKVELMCCEQGIESESLVFFVEVGTYDEYRRYEIVPDPENGSIEYQAKFDPKFAMADVYDDGRVVVNPRPEEPPDDGSSGCFIDTLKKEKELWH